MGTLLGSIVAAALLAQLPGVAIQGSVTDDQGKPAAGTRVIAHAPYSRTFVGSGDPVELETKTDASGKFRLVLPVKLRGAVDQVYVWAYRPGLALAVAWQLNPSAPFDMTLRKPVPKTIKVEGSDGKPIAGAVVVPRIIRGSRSISFGELPGTLSLPLAATTGPDGQAAIGYLAGDNPLDMARVSAPSIGTQDLPLVDFRHRTPQPANIVIRLKSTGNLAGHVRNSEARPVAGQTVEVWSRGVAYLSPTRVEFQNGPVRTRGDGLFRTPDNLLVGSQYRLVIRSQGMEPVASKWITITDQPHVLFPFIQKPLRTISGRAVDRQGRPVAEVELFQSGDGPERTATRSGRDGRFALSGFQQGQVVLFARGEGFRFFGRLIKPGEDDIAVELTRKSERPRRAMRMLSDPIPLEESRALAKRLMEPYWEAAVAQNDPGAMERVLMCLAAADPDGVLEKLEKAAEHLPVQNVSSIKYSVALALARTDLARALDLGETIDPTPGMSRMILGLSPLFVLMADAQPPGEREQKLALLARAAKEAKASKFQVQVADVAERLYELGEKEKAKALIAESLRMKPDAVPSFRGRFARRLARFDPPAALALAKDLSARSPRLTMSLYWNIALRLATENPAEAERVLRMAPRVSVRSSFAPSVIWKMAQIDPARAQRLADEAQGYRDDPEIFLFLALGLKSQNPAAAEQAFWRAMEGIDQWMKQDVEYSNYFKMYWILLPLVEQIDPALVPEFFWRAVALRLPPGDPRQDVDHTPSELAMLLGWYDRGVAALLFEPARARLEEIQDAELDSWTIAFMGWSMFDPRAAVERLTRASAAAGVQNGPSHSCEVVAELLGLPWKDRWQKIWDTYTDMRYVLDHDIP